MFNKSFSIMDQQLIDKSQLIKAERRAHSKMLQDNGIKMSATEYDMLSNRSRRQSFNDNSILSVRSSKILVGQFTRESEKRAKLMDKFKVGSQSSSFGQKRSKPKNQTALGERKAYKGDPANNYALMMDQPIDGMNMSFDREPNSK